MATSSFTVRLLDSCVRVSASGVVCAAASALWHASLTDEPPTSVLRIDPELADAAALEQLATRLNRLVLGEARWLTVHAGVVATGDRGIAFPAESGVGKSTLVAACVLGGLQYVSDEALALADDGTASPYPRPIGLAEDSLALLGRSGYGTDAGAERLVAPEALGVVATGAVAVRHVVLPVRNTGAVPGLEPLTAPDGLHMLLANAFNHYRSPAAAVAIAAAVVGGADIWRLVYGDAPDAVPLLASLLT